MAEICGTFEGHEREKGHRWGRLVQSQADEKVFFHRRSSECDEAKLKRIKDEIALVNELNYSNIQTPIELFSTPNGAEIFVYSKLAEFGSADRILSVFYNYGFPERMIQNIFCQIMPAIVYIHEQGIIHRGLCAKNILLRADGTALLGGFNHAIKLKKCNRWIGVEDKVHDFDESLQNILAWLAPEVLKQDINGYGLACDIYSVGITLCEMGNGFPPFNEMEPLQILYEKTRGSTPFLVDSTNTVIQPDSHESIDHPYKKPAFSAEINDVVAKCLAYNADERPTSSELLRHKFLNPPNNQDPATLRKMLSELLLSKVMPLTLIVKFSNEREFIN